MTLERPMFPPRTSGLRIVGGTDCKPAETKATAPTDSPRRPRGRQAAYSPCRDWISLKPPQGNDDPIFHEIERHLNASMAYNRAVEAETAAEGKVSESEYERLQDVTKTAFDDMMLFARALVLVGPKSRQGLMRVARYLALQFNDPVGCQNGCQYMPDEINGHPWPKVFLGALARNLRKMGAEFPEKPSRKSAAARTARRSPTFVEFVQNLRRYLVQEFARGRDLDQIFDDLEESYGRVEASYAARHDGEGRQP
jgi:hypothetical protein